MSAISLLVGIGVRIFNSLGVWTYDVVGDHSGVGIANVQWLEWIAFDVPFYCFEITLFALQCSLATLKIRLNPLFEVNKGKEITEEDIVAHESRLKKVFRNIVIFVTIALIYGTILNVIGKEQRLSDVTNVTWWILVVIFYFFLYTLFVGQIVVAAYAVWKFISVNRLLRSKPICVSGTDCPEAELCEPCKKLSAVFRSIANKFSVAFGFQNLMILVRFVLYILQVFETRAKDEGVLFTAWNMYTILTVELLLVLGLIAVRVSVYKPINKAK